MLKIESDELNTNERGPLHSCFFVFRFRFPPFGTSFASAPLSRIYMGLTARRCGKGGEEKKRNGANAEKIITTLLSFVFDVGAGAIGQKACPCVEGGKMLGEGTGNDRNKRRKKELQKPRKDETTKHRMNIDEKEQKKNNGNRTKK